MTSCWRRPTVSLLAILLMGLLSQAQQPRLGPLDGEGLPPTGLTRVEVGSVAPDFRLADEAGGLGATN